ncbi:MAG: Nif3-like dinuclear metal center hexameric protein [Candidatus Methylopumilus sp.]
MELKQLVNYTRQLLQVERFVDYCPNGLQVEGKPNVNKIVTGVSASMDLLQAAKQAGADAVLVHHGYFWKNEDACVVGMKRQRIQFLLENEISLLAYHLPLDAHPELGNNAQLAKVLALELETYSGNQNLIAQGRLSHTQTLAAFADFLGAQLGRTPLVIGDLTRPVKTLAWCTGGAQGYMADAIALGVDLFISGEISEQTVHLARESGVAYISAGHHATERYGVKALGEHIAQQFGLAHSFIDIDNPV